jgi:hypothetical protein
MKIVTYLKSRKVVWSPLVFIGLIAKRFVKELECRVIFDTKTPLLSFAAYAVLKGQSIILSAECQAFFSFIS